MHCASSHNQKKNNNKFKNKKQPELTENRTVWKSDNQGVKEDTFIQTGRRDRDGQLGGGLTARQQLADRRGGVLQTGRFHIHVQINWEEQLGSEADHATQSFSAGE